MYAPRVQGATAGYPTPSPALPSNNGVTDIIRDVPVITGVSPAHWLVPTSSDFSPTGSGGCIKEKYFPRRRVLRGIGSDESNGTDFTLTLKNGVGDPGWETVSVVTPPFPESMSNTATCSGNKLRLGLAGHGTSMT